MNNMSPRERILMMAILLMVPIGGIFIGFLTFNNSMQDKKMLIQSTTQQIADMENKIYQAQRAEERRTEYRNRSLPPDPQVAEIDYRAWLMDLGEDEVGLNGFKVNPASPTSKKFNNQVIYDQYSYSITAQGTLDQVTDFLHRFYSVNYLHRIRSMTMRPIKTRSSGNTPSRDDILELGFTIQAIGLPGADAKRKLDDTEGNRLQYEGYVDYEDRILRRNLFGPPNNAPSFDSPTRESFSTEDEIEFAVAADDDDRIDSLSIELLESNLEGVEFEAGSSGRARLRAPAQSEGRYFAKFKVTDDGLPPKSDVHEVEIAVSVPQPVVEPDPPPQFDISRYSIITAIVRDSRGIEQVWIDVKPLGELYQLSPGDEFEIGSMSGVVESVSDARAVLKMGDYRHTFKAGDKLYLPAEAMESGDVVQRFDL